MSRHCSCDCDDDPGEFLDDRETSRLLDVHSVLDLVAGGGQPLPGEAGALAHYLWEFLHRRDRSWALAEKARADALRREAERLEKERRKREEDERVIRDYIALCQTIGVDPETGAIKVTA